MTSGYKSQAELEYEREKKKKENEYRPVPTEWRVEQLEKSLNKNHDEYMKHLEKARQKEVQEKLSLPPPPPPPAGVPGPSRPSGRPAVPQGPSGRPAVPQGPSGKPAVARVPSIEPICNQNPQGSQGPSKVQGTKFKTLYNQFVKSTTPETDNLPDLNCNPWEQFGKR